MLSLTYVVATAVLVGPMSHLATHRAAQSPKMLSGGFDPSNLAASADTVIGGASAAIGGLTQSVQSTATSAVEAGLTALAPVLSSAGVAARPALDALAPVLSRIDTAALQSALYGMDGDTQGFLAISALVLLELAREISTVQGDPYPDAKYDAAAARRFFSTRPLEVLTRAFEIVVRSGGFGSALLGNWLAGPAALAANSDARALDLARVLTALGPTFIKAGQSASIRTDLLPVAYVRGLTSLQDQVRKCSISTPQTNPNGRT